MILIYLFIDVDTIPENGTWFQLIQNGTLTINEGPNGLQKLDKVMELAKNHGLYVLLSLTNNWNPRPLTDNIPVTDPLSALRLGARDNTPGTNNTHPRGFLSNDYGALAAPLSRSRLIWFPKGVWMLTFDSSAAQQNMTSSSLMIR